MLLNSPWRILGGIGLRVPTIIRFIAGLAILQTCCIKGLNLVHLTDIEMNK